MVASTLSSSPILSVISAGRGTSWVEFTGVRTMRSACMESLTISEIEARMEEAMIAPAHTRAMPTTRAADVAAVLRGAAARLRAASRPTGRTRRSGIARTAMVRRASTGEATSRPRTRAPAPMPSTALR